VSGRVHLPGAPIEGLLTGLVLVCIALLVGLAGIGALGCTTAPVTQAPPEEPIPEPGRPWKPEPGIMASQILPAKSPRTKQSDVPDPDDADVWFVPWARYVGEDGEPVDLERHVWLMEPLIGDGWAIVHDYLMVVKPTGLLIYRWVNVAETRTLRRKMRLPDELRGYGAEHRRPPSEREPEAWPVGPR